MGAIWSQQGCLRLSSEQGRPPKLEVGRIYHFKKEKHRLYMLDTPMPLITEQWQSVATVMITEITVGHGFTSGTFEVLKVFTPEEIKVVSGTAIPYTEIKK